MKLNEIFLKDVNRSIEGVVKADDVESNCQDLWIGVSRDVLLTS